MISSAGDDKEVDAFFLSLLFFFLKNLKGPQFINQIFQKKMDLTVRQNREKIQNFKAATLHLIRGTSKQAAADKQVCVFK